MVNSSAIEFKKSIEKGLPTLVAWGAKKTFRMYVPIADLKQFKNEINIYMNEQNHNFKWDTLFGSAINSQREISITIK
jgi:hypothetical protein